MGPATGPAMGPVMGPVIWALCETAVTTEHTHAHDEDSASAVAHGAVAPVTGRRAREAGERPLVACSPRRSRAPAPLVPTWVSGFLLEPDPARAGGAAALGFRC